MNEPRQQAYFQLIENLLDCPSGEEAAILEAHQDLLDAGFLQALAAVAEYLSQQGDENNATWLRDLATNLRESLNLPATTPDLNAYQGFLQEILQATADSNGDTQVVYPFLAANIDKLNDIFGKLLSDWATNTFAEAESETAEYIAGVIGNFSNLIQQFPLGDKASNMEIAITCDEIALTIFTRADFPQNWATMQNNLGNAYLNRIRGDKADNLEQAIIAYSAALEIRTRADFSQDWGMTQNNLGNAYLNRIRGDKAENLEQAIAAYSAALEIRTRASFPENWALTQNNLGTAYSERIRGDRAENLEKAIAAYSAALEILTRTDFPQNWATTQNNLGNAYRKRIREDKADNLQLAIKAYSAALEILTRTDFPQYHAETLLNLGILYQDSKQFTLAESTFASAIDTVEILRNDIVSGEESKRKQAEEWNELYKRMVEVCLELRKETLSIEYIERSKTRNLVELILGDTRFKPIQYSEIQNLLDNETAIIEFYIFNDCFRAFIIIDSHKNPIIWQSASEDIKELKKLIRNYLELYYTNKDQWIEELNNQFIQLGKILHLNEIISLIPRNCQKLILIPHRYLHLLPFHALPIQESYLIDLFPKGVGYAPSCQILQQVQNRQRNDFQSFFAFQTPTKDLYEKDLGAVTAIKKQFVHSSVLNHNQATRAAIFSVEDNENHGIINENLLKANCVLFFCHGSFNPLSPLESSLQLADESLTLSDIINDLKLENCRLVTLFACETGLIDFRNTSDEYIGLPSGFLLAGSNNVVSSLWAVSGNASALLMVRFYEELQHENNIVVALNTAQRWLRDTTVKAFREWLSHSSVNLAKQEQLDRHFANIAKEEGDNTQPYASPFLINDTYAADLTLIPESANISIDLPQLQHFKPSSLLPSHIESSLGQTFWIYGEVDPNEDCDLVSEKFSTALLAGTNLNPVRTNKGDFFGSFIFEYQANDPNEPNNPAKKAHILIELNQTQSGIPQTKDSYEWLLNLLCCYHKIIYIYDQARHRYSDARKIYSDLDKKIEEFNILVHNSSQLSDLKQLLTEIPRKNLDYTRCLQDLQIHETAIKTNITNYRICLDKITPTGSIPPQFWQDFINKYCEKWQKQVETDINYLSPGQELFGRFVDTIRGVIETQQAESDRSLERTIQIASISLGGGAIASGVITQHIDKILPPKQYNLFYASLLLSLIATLWFIAVGFFVTQRRK